MDNVREVDELLTKLEALAATLPETIDADEVKHHEWLRRLLIAAHDITSRVDANGFDWIKSHNSRTYE